MTKIMFAVATAAMIAMSTSAFAAKSDDAPSGACEGLKIGSGANGKGYANIVKDMIKVCGAEVNICEVNTEGGLDNLTSMSTKSLDMGLAQVDTWSTMKNGDENIAALQGVFGLNSNFMHIVTATNGFSVEGAKKFGGLMKGDAKRVVIGRFSELRGQTVAATGSAQLLIRQLDRQFNYGMNIVDAQTDEAAFKLVSEGRVAAAVTVSSWPSGSVKKLNQSAGLTLVPFDATLPNGSSYGVRSLNYKNIGVYNNNSLAIQNLLFTRPFKGEKAQEVAKLKACIVKNLENLQEGDYQPAWNEIKNIEDTFGVPKFNANTKAKASK